jgi:hypothetical protein
MVISPCRSSTTELLGRIKSYQWNSPNQKTETKYYSGHAVPSESGETMSKRPRRNHTSAFKAKVALAAIKGDRTLAQLAEQLSGKPVGVRTMPSVAASAHVRLCNERDESACPL